MGHNAIMEIMHICCGENAINKKNETMIWSTFSQVIFFDQGNDGPGNVFDLGF